MKTLNLIFLLLLFASTIWSIGLQGERYANEGLEYYYRGEYQNAIQSFTAANKAADSEKPEYFYWLGRLNIAVEDTASAKYWLNKYSASQDSTFSKQNQEYLDILNRQKLIFEQAGTRDLPHYMNSRNSDYGAVITPDGKYVYFTSLRPAKTDKENIWRAERLNNSWGKPVLVEELNTDKNEAVGSFSQDGKTVYLTGNYSRSKIDGDLYTSQLITNSNGKPKWDTPKLIADINSPQVDVQPYVYEDKWMFFTSSRAGGMGGTDIYVSEKVEDKWKEPINLGANVNTGGNEQTPFLEWDGKTLFFASNGHPGFGGYDLFKAVKIGETWTDWSAAENLGLPINSVKNDRYYFHQKDTNASFISTERNPEGYENILFANVVYAPSEYLLVDEATGKKQTVPVEGVTDSTKAAARKYTLIGNVVDEKRKPVQTELEINYDLDGVMMQSYTKTDDKGDFKIELPYAHSYNVVINDTGNFIFSQDLQPQDNTDSLYTEIMLKKMETKKVFVFNNIQFDFDSSVIREVSYPILNDIALTLINNPEIKVEISGHTCNMGSAKYNQWLSDRRAKAIVNYLISKDVEAERMTSIGYGLSKPIADNKTLSGKKLNRRVEVKVIE